MSIVVGAVSGISDSGIGAIEAGGGGELVDVSGTSVSLCLSAQSWNSAGVIFQKKVVPVVKAL